jgi:hypothetical protein
MSTPVRTDVQRHFLEQTQSAHGVYLAAAKRVGELEHFFIAEVWRHDAALGAAPRVGSEWAPENARPPGTIAPDQVLILVTATERGRTTGMTPIAHGRVMGSNFPVGELRATIRSTQASSPVPPPLRPGPSPLDHGIADASAVYLVRTDLSDGLIRYRVSEVWRHRGAGPVPKIGDEVMPDPKRKVKVHPEPPPDPKHKIIHAETPSTGVAFIFPKPTTSAGLNSWRSSEVRFVINGYIPGYGSLFDLYQSVTKADATVTPAFSP